MEKYIFISNYLNHHQIPICEAFKSNPDIDFYLIQTEAMTDERIKLGWSLKSSDYPYLVDATNDDVNAVIEKYCEDADVVILGDCKININKINFKTNVLIWLYRERLFKKSIFQKYNPVTIYKLKKKYSIYKGKNVGLLCASAYTAGDFKGIVDFPAGCYKWGYFPPFISYNAKQIISDKMQQTTLKIAWVGRLIDWKRTCDAIYLAEKLDENNIPFEMNIVGDGNLKNQIQEMIFKKNLQNCVFLHNSKTPEQVRELMLSSHILLSTSNRKEGWGAVLNEGMNSLCVVIAPRQVGAAPYLIKHMENGLMYSCGNINQLYKLVLKINCDRDKMSQLAMRAYETISNTWNAEAAANRLAKLSEYILSEKENAVLFNEDVCSRAD